VLRHLGIDYTLCVATSGGVGATIQTPQGALAANSADLRNYFRQFDAVILCDHALTLSETAVINYSVYWLSWNDPEDPAVPVFQPALFYGDYRKRVQQQLPQRFPDCASESQRPCRHALRSGRGQPELGITDSCSTHWQRAARACCLSPRISAPM
jgi:hypothetical protein